MSDKGPFDLGYSAGYRAGMTGDPQLPSPPPIRSPGHEKFAEEFAKSAAIGYVRGVEDWEKTARRIEDDLGFSRD